MWLFTYSENQKSEKPVLLVVMYRPPAGAYQEFLSEFSDFLSGLLLSSDKVIIVGDFKIRMDVDSDGPKLAFISPLESMGVSQKVNQCTALIRSWIWFLPMV